ncbi:hypothetical protein KKH27_04020 [bacterium]|nr:hypothetical protein [bacterium]MBU1984641.1 hypothetical protein [bacterium]
MKSMNRFLAALFLVLSLTLCSCLETSLVYNMNLYHDGRTVCEKRVGVQTDLSLTSKLRTSKEATTFENDFHDIGPMIGTGVRVAVSRKCDVGGNFSFNVDESGSGVGGRLYTKVQLTEPSKEFAVSIMPALGFGIGSKNTEEETGSTLSSYLVALELHAPMSYDMTRRFRFLFGGHLYYLVYAAPFERGPNELLLESQTPGISLLCPAISGGFQFGPLTPEASVVLIDGKAMAIGGVGLNF